MWNDASIKAALTWKTGEVIVPVQLSTVADFLLLMNKVRDLRRGIVNSVLKSLPLVDTWRSSLQNAQTSLEENMQEDFSRSFLLTAEDTKENAGRVFFNLRDEINGIRQDGAFVRYLSDTGWNARRRITRDGYELFCADLARSRPDNDQDKFNVEVKRAQQLLKGKSVDAKDNDSEGSVFDLMVTDWDGTMKNYGSNYSTCMQPAYSAVALSLFAAQCTRFAAILTAGPLSGLGILDLTAMDPDHGHLTFGGSWGREWLLGESRVVDESAFTDVSRRLLSQLTASVEAVLAEHRFSAFRYVGSGFQRKVDRLTLGIQNVSEDISSALVHEYLARLENNVAQIDPDHCHFVIHRGEWDVEIIIKASDTGDAWDKAHGLDFLIRQLEMDPTRGRVLICGDTASDLPMLEYAVGKNPDRTSTVFVNPSSKVEQLIAAKMPNANQYCFVSCPQVLHVAMLNILHESGSYAML